MQRVEGEVGTTGGKGIELMDESNRDFAQELIKGLGEDRFYHAMQRAGYGEHSKSFYEALGGDRLDWDSKKRELRLIVNHSIGVADYATSRKALCATAFVISSRHKEFARKSPLLPASIHARMMLDEQNEWTKKYADNLSERSQLD